MNTNKRSALLPPFEQQCQLTTDQDIDEVGALKLTEERERLRKSLSTSALETMHQQLWYAGRKGNISPLHHQRVIQRSVVLTEQARLHLVWFEKTIYVKRLENELLNWRYFSEVVCGDADAHQAATGFLLSYAHLIEHPSDLAIAQASGLIDKNITWRAWKQVQTSLLHHLDNRQVHDRYEYGELRLGRLNQICRIRGLGLSYFTVHREYSSYFGENYVALVALFGLATVALSAMQVIMGFRDVPAVLSVTVYRFSVATLVAVAASCAVLLGLYIGLYVWNWLLIFVRRSPRRR